MTKNGFAIISNGNIMVETVSPRRIGALVNWLCAGPPRIVMTNNITDATIEGLWKRHKADSDEVVAVVIAAIGSAS